MPALTCLLMATNLLIALIYSAMIELILAVKPAAPGIPIDTAPDALRSCGWPYILMPKLQQDEPLPQASNDCDKEPTSKE